MFLLVENTQWLTANTSTMAASTQIRRTEMAVFWGMDIPGRISLLGYDDIEYASLPKIRLSTLAQPTGALAESAVRLLLELIDSGGPGEFTHKLIAPRLVERSTCRPPRQKTAV